MAFIRVNSIENLKLLIQHDQWSIGLSDQWNINLWLSTTFPSVLASHELCLRAFWDVENL